MKAAVVATLLGLAAATYPESSSTPAESTTSCESSSSPSTYVAQTTYQVSTYAASSSAAPTYPASSSSECEYTTEVVTAYTTYCSEATVITHGQSTYPVTAPGTVTITNCPCTITHPVTSIATVDTPVGTPAQTPPAAQQTTPAAAPPAPYPVANTTVPAAAPPAPAPAGNGTASSPPISKGGASSLTASGAALAGIVALAAFLF